MKLIHLLMLAPFVLAPTMVGCSGADEVDSVVDEEGEGATEDELKSGSVVLTMKEDGKTINVQAGKDLIVKLAEKPSAGYRWSVESVDGSLSQPVISHKGPGADGPVGAGRTAIFTWKTSNEKVGTHKVKLAYKRAWETDTPPAKVFSVTVKVVAAPAGVGERCGGYLNIPCASSLDCVINRPNGAIGNFFGVCKR